MSTAAIILAAGLGTRMRSALPKALHPIAGRPMLQPPAGRLRSAVFDRIVVVVGPGMPALERAAAPHATVVQAERLGTGHAALQAAPRAGRLRRRRGGALRRQPADHRGDAPPAAGRAAPRRRRRWRCWRCARPTRAATAGWCRTSRQGDVRAHRGMGGCRRGGARRSASATPACSAPRPPTCSAGCGAVRNDNAKGEYYLTDVVALARAEGRRVAAEEAPEAELARRQQPGRAGRRRGGGAGARCARRRWRAARPWRRRRRCSCPGTRGSART